MGDHPSRFPHSTLRPPCGAQHFSAWKRRQVQDLGRERYGRCLLPQRLWPLLALWPVLPRLPRPLPRSVATLPVRSICHLGHLPPCRTSVHLSMLLAASSAALARCVDLTRPSAVGAADFTESLSHSLDLPAHPAGRAHRAVTLAALARFPRSFALNRFGHPSPPTQLFARLSGGCSPAPLQVWHTLRRCPAPRHRTHVRFMNNFRRYPRP